MDRTACSTEGGGLVQVTRRLLACNPVCDMFAHCENCPVAEQLQTCVG